MQEYSAFWKNYVNFTDRTTVRGYWMAVLFHVIIIALLLILSTAVPVFAFLYYIYGLATIIPGLAIVVRRLHDINKSGWWFFIILVPAVGAILLIVWYCSKSVDEGNRFGTAIV